MARQHFVVIALVFFAVVGMASATDADPPAEADVTGATADDVIGNTDGGSEPEAAPVGGPVSSEAFPNGTPSTDGPTAAGGAGASAATSLHSLSFTGGAVLAILAGALFF